MSQMQQERELAQLQQEIFAHTANTIEIGADTLNVLHAQREQTQNDMRKIECINAKLSAAEILIKKMERGMFNLGGTSSKIKAPPSKPSDTDFKIQVKRTMRYGTHILRFTKTFFLRLNGVGDEVQDTVNYGLLGSILVHRADKYFTISFNIKGVKPWLVYATRHKDIIKEMVKRARASGFDPQVEFESGTQDFSYVDDSLQGDMVAGLQDPDGTVGTARMLEAYTAGGGKVDMDDMYDVLSNGLSQIQEISQKQQQVIAEQTKDLAEMQPQVVGLHSSIEKANQRVKNIR